jgi:hypothetical protein
MIIFLFGLSHFIFTNFARDVKPDLLLLIYFMGLMEQSAQGILFLISRIIELDKT